MAVSFQLRDNFRLLSQPMCYPRKTHLDGAKENGSGTQICVIRSRKTDD